MRKSLLVSLVITVLVLCLGIAGYAQTDVITSISSSGEIGVDVISDYGEALYTIYFLKPGFELSEISGDGSDAFAGAEEIKFVSENGRNYTSQGIKFQLDANAERGTYTVVIGGGELSGKIIKVTYPAADAEKEAIEKVNSATAATLGDILNQYQNKVWSLDTEKQVYKTNPQTVYENMVAIMDGKAESAQDVTTAYDVACILAEIKSCSEENLFDAIFRAPGYMEIEYEDIVYEKNDEFKSIVANMREELSLKTPEDLDILLKSAEALVLLNKADNTSVIDILKSNNGVFNLSFDDGFEEVDPYQLAKKMTAGIPYQSVDSVVTSYNTAIKDLTGSENETQTDNNNSGGGGFGGGGGSLGRVDTITADVSSTDQGVTSDNLLQIENMWDFSDLESAEWARPYIVYLSKNGIVQGDGNGKFRPNEPVMREEFLKLLIEALGVQKDTAQSTNFADVSNDAWYADYVQTGVNNKIVNGVSKEYFGIGQPISRQDATVMVMRAVKSADKSLAMTYSAVDFSDSNKIADYARDAVSLLVKAGVINGYETGEFCPENSISRAEAAKMIYCMLRGLME